MTDAHKAAATTGAVVPTAKPGITPAPTGTTPPRLRPMRPAQTRQRGRRILYFGLGAIGAGALGYALLRDTPVAVEAGTVVSGDVRVVVESDGETHVVRRHTLVAPTAGVLARIPLHAGDSVHDGQVVGVLTAAASAMLDPITRQQAEARAGSAAAAVAQAKAQAMRARMALEQSQRDLDRSRQLEAAGAIAPQQLEQLDMSTRQRRAESVAANEGVHVAEHELAAARAALRTSDRDSASSRVTVRSPLTGVVLRVLHEDEGVVPVGTPLLEIGDPSTIEVRTDILSDDAARLHPGAPARVIMATGDTVAGTLTRIEPAAFTKRSSLGVDEQRVRVAVRLTPPEQQGRVLGDGYRVSVILEQGSTGATITVPVGALVRRGDAWAVYEVRDGRAVLVTISVGARNASFAQVLSGLTPGNRVILYPSDQVKDNGQVAVRTP